MYNEIVKQIWKDRLELIIGNILVSILFFDVRSDSFEMALLERRRFQSHFGRMLDQKMC